MNIIIIIIVSVSASVSVSVIMFIILFRCLLFGYFPIIEHCLVTEAKAGKLGSYQISWSEDIVI